MELCWVFQAWDLLFLIKYVCIFIKVFREEILIFKMVFFFPFSNSITAKILIRKFPNVWFIIWTQFTFRIFIISLIFFLLKEFFTSLHFSLKPLHFIFVNHTNEEELYLQDYTERKYKKKTPIGFLTSVCNTSHDVMSRTLWSSKRNEIWDDLTETQPPPIYWTTIETSTKLKLYITQNNKTNRKKKEKIEEKTIK